MRFGIATCAAFAWCVMASAASAATATDTFQVTATVVASCSVDAANLSFGSYDPVSATPLDGSTSISVHCTNGAGYVLGLDEGVGASATVSARQMSNGGQTLTYALYQDSGRTTVWGETSGVNTVAGTGSGAVQTVTIYGRAPAQQAATAGSYTDTVTVTVTY
ncbi:MAG: spore coat U domain-containing protein [Hyphomonadaceae bacterium]|nr:spore coat U domain-containing protein [Hyphomonadaceae bacterium]